MGEICETRSILGTRIRQMMAGTANGFAPNSHGRRVWSFARTSWNVKVKTQKSRSPETNGLVADNVAQAAGASI